MKKYWLVLQVQPDGLLKVLTRRGKERNVAASDPRLRPARWWEIFFFRDSLSAGKRFQRRNAIAASGVNVGRRRRGRQRNGRFLRRLIFLRFSPSRRERTTFRE